MKDRLLLISHDVALAQRVQALVQRLSVDLQWRHQFEPPARWPEAFPDAMIVLLDEDSLPEDPVDLAEDAAAEEGKAGFAIGQGRPRPVTLLLASQGVRRTLSLCIGFRDIVYKDQRLSHLSWVLQEHLNALRLRRVRQRQEREDEADLDPRVFSLRHEVSNPLSGILGNAELALTGRSKLPVDVRERLERIVQLAMQIRELLHTRTPDEFSAAGDGSRREGAHAGALLGPGTGSGSTCSPLR